MVNVKFLYKGNLDTPKVHTEGSAGLDLFNNGEDVTIASGDSAIVSTGTFFEIPEGYVGLVFVRSSIGFKYDCTLSNSVGVIDSDYRGEVKVKIKNLSGKEYTFKRGDRIAQIVILPCINNFIQAEELNDTERGAGGFGSTGN